jgi:hypothetical protein
VIRLLLLLLGTLSAGRPGERVGAWYRADDPDGAPEPGTGYPGPNGPVGTDGWRGGPEALPPWPEMPGGPEALPPWRELPATASATAGSRSGSSGALPCS